MTGHPSGIAVVAEIAGIMVCARNMRELIDDSTVSEIQKLRTLRIHAIAIEHAIEAVVDSLPESSRRVIYLNEQALTVTQAGQRARVNRIDSPPKETAMPITESFTVTAEDPASMVQGIQFLLEQDARLREQVTTLTILLTASLGISRYNGLAPAITLEELLADAEAAPTGVQAIMRATLEMIQQPDPNGGSRHPLRRLLSIVEPKAA